MKDMCVISVNILFVLVCSLTFVSSEEIQDERLCANKDCSELISVATAQIRYVSGIDGALSFKPNDIMEIFSKTTEEDTANKRGYWGAELKGKRGYVPPNLIKEFKTYVKDLRYVVPTEVGLKKKLDQLNAIEPSQTELVPDIMVGVAAEFGDGGPPNTPYTVLDGTTMYIGIDGERIEPSSTQEQPLKTDTIVGNGVREDVLKEDINQVTMKMAEVGSEETEGEDTGDDDDENYDNDDDDDGDEGEEEEASNTDNNDELEKKIEEGLRNGPGLSPENDALILGRMRKNEVPVVESKSPILNPNKETPLPPISPESDKIPDPTSADHLQGNIEINTSSFNDPSLSPDFNPSSSDVIISKTAAVEKLEASPTLGEAFSENVTSQEVPESLLHEKSSLNVEATATQPPVSTEGATTNTVNIEKSVETTVSPVEIGETNSETGISLGVPASGTPTIDDEIVQLPTAPTVTESPPVNMPSIEQVPPTLPPVPPESFNVPVRTTTLGARPSIYPGLVRRHQLPNSEPVTISADSVDEPLNDVQNSPDSDPSQRSKDGEDVPVSKYIISSPAPPPAAEANTNVPQLNFTDPTLILADKVEAISNSREQSITSSPSSPTHDPYKLVDDVEVPIPTAPPSEHLHLPESQTVSDVNHSPTVATPDSPTDTITTEVSESSSLEYASLDAPEPNDSPELPSLNVPGTVTEGGTSETEGFFSGLSGMFSGIFGSGSDSSIVEHFIPDDIVSNNFETVDVPFQENLSEGNTLTPSVAPEGQCKSVIDLETDCDDAPTPHLFEFFERKTSGSAYTFVYLVITAVTVLIFTLGHYFIERNRQDGPLIAKVNQLTRELQVASSQLESRAFKESGSLAEVNNEVLAALQGEVDDLRRIKSEQEALIESQQQELDSVTEAGMELNRMLSDLLTQKNGSDNLLISVEQLQDQLDSQQRIIDEMNKNLVEKNAENDALQAVVTTTQEKNEALEEELCDMKQNLNMHLKEKEEVILELEERNAKLQLELSAALKSNTNEVMTLRKSLDDVSENLAVRESEFKALSETIEQLKGKGEVDATALYDVGTVKAELLRVQTERDALRERLNDEEGARRLLEDFVKTLDAEVGTLRTACETAEKEKSEAETRLAVLSNYFKEKETQLQKELGLQEAMWVQKQGDETSVFERIKSLQEEVDNYNFDSFPTSNEGLSIQTSLSSTSYEPRSSSPSLNALNISPKTSGSIQSLPETPRHKFKILSRRKSSVAFEARLEKVHQMTSSNSSLNSPRPIPEDLLLLEELKTVKASPFRESCSTPESEHNDKPTKHKLHGSTSKLSHMAKKFEKEQNTSKFCGKGDNFSDLISPEVGKRPPECTSHMIKNNICDIVIPSSAVGELSPESVPLRKFENKFSSESGDDIIYNFGPPSLPEKEEPLNLPLIPIPAPRKNWENDISRLSPKISNTTDKTEFEAKDCEVQSSASATVEFDIKVVANATSNVMKVKKMTAKPQQGSQNDMLKKEILDQERGLKGQIATLEKKAHENWVAARQAERRLEESKQEAGQLRNMLTLIEKSQITETDGKTPGRLPGDLNGEESLPPILGDGTSPLPFPPPLPLDPLAPPPLLPPGFMPPPFMHPPPSGFIPPPPFHPGDRRPAPLGRMSSPPLNSRFSPAPGDYDDYDRMSPAPLSPPVRNFRSPPMDGDRFKLRNSEWYDGTNRGSSRGFRPVASQRESRRDYQGSNHSSGHSSNESLDKPRPKA